MVQALFPEWDKIDNRDCLDYECMNITCDPIPDMTDDGEDTSVQVKVFAAPNQHTDDDKRRYVISIPAVDIIEISDRARLLIKPKDSN